LFTEIGIDSTINDIKRVLLNQRNNIVFSGHFIQSEKDKISAWNQDLSRVMAVFIVRIYLLGWGYSHLSC